MKTFLLLFFLLPIFALAQSSSETMASHQSFVTPNRDTLYLANNDLGLKILQLWVDNGSYKRNTTQVKNISVLGCWRTSQDDQKPKVIFLVDEAVIQRLNSLDRQ